MYWKYLRCIIKVESSGCTYFNTRSLDLVQYSKKKICINIKPKKILSFFKYYKVYALSRLNGLFTRCIGLVLKVWKVLDRYCRSQRVKLNSILQHKLQITEVIHCPTRLNHGKIIYNSSWLNGHFVPPSPIVPANLRNYHGLYPLHR